MGEKHVKYAIDMILYCNNLNRKEKYHKYTIIVHGYVLCLVILDINGNIIEGKEIALTWLTNNSLNILSKMYYDNDNILSEYLEDHFMNYLASGFQTNKDMEYTIELVSNSISCQTLIVEPLYKNFI